MSAANSRLLPGEVRTAIDIVYLMRTNGGRLRTSTAIGKQLGLSSAYVRRVASRLVDAGLLTAISGRSGGYMAKLSYVTVKDLVIAMGLINPKNLSTFDTDMCKVLEKVVI